MTPSAFHPTKSVNYCLLQANLTKKEDQAKDFETGQVIPDKFVMRYSFECYDVIDPAHMSELSIWQRGTSSFFLLQNLWMEH